MDSFEWINEAVASLDDEDFRRAQVEAILAVAAALTEMLPAEDDDDETGD